MKNKKLILVIVISIIGLGLITYGIIGYINGNKNNNKNNNGNNTAEEENYYDPDSFNEYRDLAGLDKKLIITDFKYENVENKCNFSFTMTNNYDEDINNKLLKVNFYDSNKKLLNTFEYNVDYLGVHSRIGIDYHVEVDKEVTSFTYEFDNEVNDIEVTNN